MSQRIAKLKENLHTEKPSLSIEKSRLWTESFKKTEGEPQIVRRAMALANILENITIFIEDGELIVGNTASKPNGFEISFWAGTWPQKELDGLKEEGYIISAEEEAELRAESEYWKGQTFTDRAEQLFDEERMWPFMQSPVILPPWKRGEGWTGYADSGLGLGPYALAAVDYEKVLNGGLSKIIEGAEQELRNTVIVNADSVKKADFLRAVIIAQKAIILLAKRFAGLAAELASKEANASRKSELKRIAEICQRVPANPARNFYEAMQSFWFIFLVLNPNGVISLGRFDQYMYPFYSKDIEDKKINDEEVLELLQCLRIKDMQLQRTSSRVHREKWAGMAKWHNCIIGGQTIDGKDATNELSYLILEAAKRCQTPHHTITLRVHDGTPEDLMLKALELVKTGIGMPAFIGDNSYMQYLLSEGVPITQARDYVITGCIDVGLAGRSRILAEPMFIVPLVLEYTLNNGKDPKSGKQLGLKTGEPENFKKFEDLMEAFKDQLTYFMGLAAEHNNIKVQVWSELFPDPVISSLMTDAIQEGKALFDRAFPLENVAVLNSVGMINAADSLAAVKKLVFDEKKVTMKELIGALKENWQGNGYEEMRKMFLAAPKYGNDDEYVDSIAADLYKFWADTAVTFDNGLGGKHKPSCISISAQWPGGASTGATPDGRYAGECLADGAISAMRGMDTHGPTTLLKSALKIDQVPFQATLLNMKFHPSALKTTEDLRKLSYLIRTYFGSGGKHIQFNVVNRDTLLDAQKRPEEYSDLVVRIAGYSAYFVELGKAMQDEIIGRSEHQL
ncbi:glycyl radical protein [Thermodesulfobacteriota bacterium]